MEKQGNVVGHAVTVTGYSLDRANAVPDKNGFLLRANRIDRVYAYDDQVGPFARMIWQKSGRDVLETFWGKTYAITPEFLLFPLYHKIRIPFSLLEGAIFKLDTYLETFRPKFPGVNRAEWDIFRTTANEYKSSAREDYKNLDADTMLQALVVDLPRFIWRVMLRVDDELHFDFLFDATGIAQHDLLVHMMSATEKKEGYRMILSLAANNETLRHVRPSGVEFQPPLVHHVQRLQHHADLFIG
ncbi:MAG: hypothetical protein LBF93_10885 [Zoogloeaceae bacterium]|jgi:hypothetical protein|nr:hypothetical protein [Zoogloeaceae bacterium]